MMREGKGPLTLDLLHSDFLWHSPSTKDEQTLCSSSPLNDFQPSH